MWLVITKLQFLDSCAFHTSYQTLLASSVVTTLSRSWLTSVPPNPSAPSLSFDLSVAFCAVEHFAFLEHFLHTASRKCFSSYQLPSQSSSRVLPSLNYRFGTCHGYVPSTSTRIKSGATAAVDLQHPLKEVQNKEQNWDTLYSGKSGKRGLQRVRYFQELILWAWFLHLLLSRKALNSFKVTSAPYD